MTVQFCTLPAGPRSLFRWQLNVNKSCGLSGLLMFLSFGQPFPAMRVFPTHVRGPSKSGQMCYCEGNFHTALPIGKSGRCGNFK